MVTTDVLRLETYKPDSPPDSEDPTAAGMIGRSQTLRYLRSGYQNYVENDAADEVHSMTAYICRSARLKLYKVYKSISCKGRGGDHKNRPKEERNKTPAQDLHRLVANVNQYLNVFSVLADFNYTWLTPALKGGICNAMVVDKHWTYDPVRKIYSPRYRLLPADEFTEFAVYEIRKLNNKGSRIRYLRFISTANTVLYTNRQALVNDSEEERGRRQVSGADGEKEEEVPTIARPPKKRRFTPPSQTLSAPSYEPRTLGWPEHDHHADEGGRSKTTPNTARHTEPRQALDPLPTPNDAARTPPPVKNPTLVVFKHSLDEKEPDTMLCIITVEMSLASRIKY